MKRDFITILALMIALSSCNDDALFEKEDAYGPTENKYPDKGISG